MSANPTDTAAPIHLDDSNFDATIRAAKQPVLVDFHAAWCGPCRALAPAVDAVAKEYAGRAIVAKVDVDQAPGVASQYGIVSVPTILFFKGGNAVDRVLGLVPKSSLAQRLDAALK
jgi:thioredoxin 1